MNPAWPFPEFVAPELAGALAENPANPADALAALLTAPQNERFAQVMANRIWARLMGRGIVEPVADWVMRRRKCLSPVRLSAIPRSSA